MQREAERLGYNDLKLYQKYSTVRHYFSLRSQGCPKVHAGDDAGWGALTSGRTVRRWAGDYLSETTAECDDEGEEVSATCTSPPPLACASLLSVPDLHPCRMRSPCHMHLP